MNRWRVITSLLAVMLLVSSCFATSPAPPPRGELKILSHSMARGASDSVAVQVTIKNAGSSTIELAQVKVNFHDAQGKLIDSSSDAVMNLGPGESWSFEIACSGAGCDKAKSYEIETMAGTSSGG